MSRKPGWLQERWQFHNKSTYNQIEQPGRVVSAGEKSASDSA